MSAWVTVWVAVQISEAPGASGEPLAGVQAHEADAFGSVTVTDASVVLPSLVATMCSG